jgi:hypothetical protein
MDQALGFGGFFLGTGFLVFSALGFFSLTSVGLNGVRFTTLTFSGAMTPGAALAQFSLRLSTTNQDRRQTLRRARGMDIRE